MLPESIERRIVKRATTLFPNLSVWFYPGKIVFDFGHSTIRFEDDQPAKLLWKVIRFMQLKEEGRL